MEKDPTYIYIYSTAFQLKISGVSVLIQYNISVKCVNELEVGKQ